MEFFMARKIEVSAEQRAKILELHGRDVANLEIGKRVGIDRRKVKAIILEAEAARDFEAVANARRDVAGALLREHIKNVGDVRQELLELTLPPTLRNKLDTLVINLAPAMHTKLTETKIASGLLLMEGHTVKVDNLNATQVVIFRTARREIKNAIEGLNQHVPELGPLFTRWEHSANSYNHKVQEFLNKHENDARLGITKEELRLAFLHALKIVSEKGISDEEFMMSYSSTQKAKMPLGERLLQINQIRQELKALLPIINDLKKIYAQLEELLSPAQLNKKLLISHCKYCPVP
jgi:hypothetical protein